MLESKYKFFCDSCFRLDERSYKIHMNRNSKYHISKNMEYAKESSCNNYILDGKRFHSIEILRNYYEIINKYSYGKDNKINYSKKHYDLANSILDNKEAHEIKLNESRKEAERKKMDEFIKKREAKKTKEKEKKALKLLNKKPKHENLEIKIEEIDEQSFFHPEGFNEQYPKKYEDETTIEYVNVMLLKTRANNTKYTITVAIGYIYFIAD